MAQTPVNPRIDLTFARALRAILRQDPDIVMIGEIRDLETAQIAVQASLTGHLVLATLHTNDAASAVTRLADMGVEPYLLASSLLGVLAQRLVRTPVSGIAPSGRYPPRERELLARMACRHWRDLRARRMRLVTRAGIEDAPGYTSYRRRRDARSSIPIAAPRRCARAGDRGWRTTLVADGGVARRSTTSLAELVRVTRD